MRNVLALAAALLLAGCQREAPAPADDSASAPAPVAEPAPHLFGDLGTLTRPVGTPNESAQRHFDQGLRLAYAFNHEAARRNFAEAAKLDPDCAMCWWGQALVLGPNINLPMQPEAVAPAWDALQKALALKAKARPADQALIDALATRYSAQPVEDRKALDQAYADAMRAVVAQHPDDLDAATLLAESLMDLSPWAYWTKARAAANPDTPVILSSLESVLARNPDHIGAIHYYVHATEGSPWPEKAEPHADRLAALAPGAGHLVHMPAHTYIRVGRYHDATLINLKAADADTAFMAFCKGSNGVYPLGYVPHNWHFIVMTAGLEGNSRQAMHAAEQTAQRADHSMLTVLTFMQQFVVAPLVTQVRFARWDEILATTAAPADLPYPQAMWHYARGRAFAARGDVAAAEKELAALDARAQDVSLPATAFFDINTASNVLKVAQGSLRGAIAHARGDRDAAIAALTQAVAHEDALNYNEPPDWQVPVRHALGAVLLESGKAAEAEAVYRADLGVFPRSGWSLHGLAAALEAQGRKADAEATRMAFNDAWKWADYSLEPRPASGAAGGR